jgi:chromate transport protein ChrA
MLSKKEVFVEGNADAGSKKDADEPSNILSILNKFFNKDNLKMLVAFLGIFIVLYVFLGIYFRTFGSGSQDSLVSSVNAIVLFIVASMGLNKYYHLDDEQKNNLIEYLYTTIKSEIQDIETTFGLIVLLGFIIGMKKILHLPTPDGRSSVVLDTANLLLWTVLLINILLVFFIDILNIPVIQIIEDTINTILYGEIRYTHDNGEENIPNSGTGHSTTPPQPAEEVFNVANNLYTYEDAPHVCSALGARLASYDEVEDAYNKGADWCSYGWSENQMGFFPTQKDTWKKLQSNNAMKNSCGRPGVNGGYMQNPKMRLGVNCYGVKPQASELDKERMVTSNIAPRTSKDVVTERKVAFWKENADKMLNLNPHNKGDWSSY